MRKWIAAGLAALGLCGVGAIGHAQSASQVVAITDAMIFDGTGRAPYRGAVVIRDGVIAEAGPDVRAPRGAQVVRAGGRALIPGLFDVHTHWGPAGQPGETPAVANQYLQSGVTTVNDFHQQPESFAVRREWLSQMVAPDVRFVARMGAPGGHGASWGDTNTTRWASTAEAAQAEVRALQVYRPDFIKAFADGWRYGRLPDHTSMNQSTLSALVAEANVHGQRVLSHTVTVERGKIAARAGVHIIAHSLQDARVDDEAVRLLREAGTAYAPTLAIYEPRPGVESENFANALFNVKALFDAGVPIAVGTDAGIGSAAHGVSTLRELELLVQAGLSPTDALLAGTANSARALGLDGDRGTIEAGKRADLVLVNGAPWEDIGQIRRIERVYVAGRLGHGPGLVLPEANSRPYPAPIAVAPLIDDFERADQRSSLDTVRLLDFDGGVDRSTVASVASARAEGQGQALRLNARLAHKEAPYAGVLIPLSLGSVKPVDATGYQGVRFRVRGAGDYGFRVNTLTGSWRSTVAAGPQWTEVAVPFASLEAVRPRGQDAAPAWSGDDLVQVGLIAYGEGGQDVWFEWDDVRFY